MDIELDLALEAAKPPVTARTPELARAVAAVLEAAEPEPAPAPSRWRRALRHRTRALSYALAAALVAGGTAAAHAAGWLLPQPEDGRSWDNDSAAVRVDVTLTGGKRCEAVYMVVPVETEAASAAPALWEEVWSTATEYLSTVDIGRLGSADVVAKYRSETLTRHRLAEQRLPHDEVPPRPSEDEIRVSAPGAELKAGLDAELRRRDLPTDLLMMTSGDNCAPGVRE